MRYTPLSTLCHVRETEITDSLVELFIQLEEKWQKRLTDADRRALSPLAGDSGSGSASRRPARPASLPIGWIVDRVRRRAGEGPEATVLAVGSIRLRVAPVQQEAAGQQRCRGPRGEHAQAGPWADGQLVQMDGGLDRESCGHG